MGHRLGLWGSALALVGSLCPAAALAHPGVDEGVRQYEQADFEGALTAFQEVQEVDDLTADDLVLLLKTRALVYLALGDTLSMEADLLALATFAPDTEMGPSVPPPVRSAFARLRQEHVALRLEATSAPMPGGVVLRAQVHDDSVGIVRHVRLRARVDGGEWSETEEGELTVPAASGARVEYYAEAVGPGGAVVARAGTLGEPRVHRFDGAGGEGSGRVLRPDDEGSGVLVPVLIGAGVLAVGAAVLTVVLLSGASDQTQVGAPTVVVP